MQFEESVNSVGLSPEALQALRKLKVEAHPVLLNYIEMLEECVATHVAPTKKEQPQHNATAQNGMGHKLELRIEREDNEEENVFEVTWWDCFGYCLVDLRTNTAEEARALFTALLAVTEIEAD